MELCDFSNVMKIIREYISDARALSQTDLLYEVFDAFMDDEENADYDFDNALVCRWMNGQAAITPRISKYYMNKDKEGILVSDINKNVIPILYDGAMCAEKLHDLLMLDDSISGVMKDYICKDYPSAEDEKIASFMGRLMYFILQRKFVKHGSENELSIAEGKMSPMIATYIIGCTPPNPCRHFVGRQKEIATVHNAFSSNSKVFLHGVAGMGKSEVAKAFAKYCKKEYTNQIYILYSGNLKKDIADLDFVNDRYDTSVDELFIQHNRFLNTLKEDTLLIIDNYYEMDKPDPFIFEVMKYQCHVLITTRNAMSIGENVFIDELSHDEQIALITNLSGGVYKETDTVIDILYSVHGHTFAIELVARLLKSGIMSADEVQQRLYYERAGMTANDKITVTKDGTTSKATYMEHIRKLFGLFNLSSEQLGLLKCATLIPYGGVSKRYFVRWLGHSNANRVNEIIELGFLQEDDRHEISLNELIQDLVLADYAPTITDCKTLLENIRHDCTMHGIDDPPYYYVMAHFLENCLMNLVRDDKLFLLRLYEDAFAYYDRPFTSADLDYFLHIIETTADEVGDIRDKVLLLDYKASYAARYDNDEEALEFEKQAAELITDVTKENAHLYSNIHSNLGMMYLANGDINRAKEHIEEGVRIINEFGLMYVHDTIPQAVNFAMLKAALGQHSEAMKILQKTEKYVGHDCGEYCSDYMNIEEAMGAIIISAGQERKAIDHFRNVLKASAEIYDYNMNDMWEVVSKLSEYFPDKDNGLEYLADYSKALCDKNYIY